MFGLSGPLLYGGVGLLVIVLILSGIVAIQHSKIASQKETIQAMKIAAEAWERKVEAKEERIQALQLAVAEQNKLIELSATLGRIAQERQGRIDALQSELARAKVELALIAEKYDEMRQQAVGLDVCQTYEMVLTSVAGEAPP